MSVQTILWDCNFFLEILPIGWDISKVSYLTEHVDRLIRSINAPDYCAMVGDQSVLFEVLGTVSKHSLDILSEQAVHVALVPWEQPLHESNMAPVRGDNYGDVVILLSFLCWYGYIQTNKYSTDQIELKEILPLL